MQATRTGDIVTQDLNFEPNIVKPHISIYAGMAWECMERPQFQTQNRLGRQIAVKAKIL